MCIDIIRYSFLSIKNICLVNIFSSMHELRAYIYFFGDTVNAIYCCSSIGSHIA